MAPYALQPEVGDEAHCIIVPRSVLMMCVRRVQVQRKADGLGFVCKQVVCESIGAANHALKEAKVRAPALGASMRDWHVLKSLRLLADINDFSSISSVSIEQTLQRLDHVGVCKYEDVFLHEQQHGRERKLVVCIVMEFCEKGDLAGAIGHHRDRRTPIPEPLLARWLQQIMQALSYVHSCGVLHRDLKSPNIFITRHDTVKLGDFGLARQVHPCLPPSRWAATGPRLCRGD